MQRFTGLLLPAALAAGLTAVGAGAPAFAAPPNAYVVTPLVSDQPGAPVRDKNLKNAWGVAFSPFGSPFWISDNASGKSTLYDGKGAKQSLIVAIPCPKSHGQGSSCPKTAAPTGIVFNPSPGFTVPGTNAPALFIFATEDGTISAWNGSSATTAVIVVDNARNPKPTSGAVYKGLAFGVNENGPAIFATNFRAGTVEVYDQNFKPLNTAGGFVDKNIPRGFAPFGIQYIDGTLIVTYAHQDAAKHDDTGSDGFVDAFDTDGNLLQRLASHGMAPFGLQSPWGVARASFGFGKFAGDLLIGNFGNGWINALTPTGLVPLKDPAGNFLVIDGLWNIGLGGGKNSNPATLYYTAGPSGETHGRFGTITPK
jgi:uncharacterized protein (TIGR03118 family)